MLPLELSDLNTVKSFSAKTLDLLGQEKLDYLYMNAGLSKDATEPAPNGSKWCETLVVNHICELSCYCALGGEGGNYELTSVYVQRSPALLGTPFT